MYIVAKPRPLSADQSQALAEVDAAIYPPGYLRFLRYYGEGTYCGWFNVQLPDTEVLKPFAEYGLWEHDADSPITESQIGECIAIGTTSDGDYLAVHPETAQWLWMPRHGEQIKAISLPIQEDAEDEAGFAKVLDELYRQTYGRTEETAVYYEPWTGTRRHVFLHLPQGSGQLTLPELAQLARAQFPPDLFLETPYTGLLFYRALGGYIRLNYAYQREVAVFYEQDAEERFSVMQQWLLSQGCTVQSAG
jgi:hypothetical protein